MADMVGAPYSIYCRQFKGQAGKGRGPSLVLVHDIQAGRHVSQNVQRVGDLRTEANMGGMALKAVGSHSGPGRANSLP
jgi:hypothetical protein